MDIENVNLTCISSERPASGWVYDHFKYVAPAMVCMVAHPTIVSLTWALIELSRNPEQQTKLRNELTEFYHRTGGDPTYEQLQSATALPFLDAVVHEVLRLHPPLVETNRVAQEDDVIPVLYPLTTKDGQVVDHIVVKKGQGVSVPIRLLGRSTVFWGEDAKEFKPQRWLDMQEEKNSLKAKELSGYRHLLTFSDGPRTCLGKAFALAEFKVCNTSAR